MVHRLKQEKSWNFFCECFGNENEQQIDHYIPYQACWSPCTSIARPKSANFTAAPFALLASNRFSGYQWTKNK